MRAPWRPLAITAAIGAVALAAVLLSARTGWLGPNVGRGDSFCEAARPGWIRQPVNTWSNLGFMVAGLAIACLARRPSGWMPSGRGLTTALAVGAVLANWGWIPRTCTPDCSPRCAPSSRPATRCWHLRGGIRGQSPGV